MRPLRACIDVLVVGCAATALVTALHLYESNLDEQSVVDSTRAALQAFALRLESTPRSAMCRSTSTATLTASRRPGSRTHRRATCLRPRARLGSSLHFPASSTATTPPRPNLPRRSWCDVLVQPDSRHRPRPRARSDHRRIDLLALRVGQRRGMAALKRAPNGLGPLRGPTNIGKNCDAGPLGPASFVSWSVIESGSSRDREHARRMPIACPSHARHDLTS